MDTISQEIKSKKYFHLKKRNPEVRTVEGEMEKCLYDLKFISECNYGI